MAAPLRAAGPADAVPLDAIRRVLVVKLRNLGDVLLVSPLISALAARGPHLEIDTLLYAETAPMLSGHPGLAQLHAIDRSWKSRPALGRMRAELGLLGQLRARRYDLVIHLTEHRRGAWLTRLLRPRYAVAPAGDHGRFFDRSFTHRFRFVAGNRRHTVETHLDCLRRLGIDPGPGPHRLSFAPGDEAMAVVRTILQASALEGRDYIVVHPASRWHFKCWPLGHMAQLIADLQARGHRIVLTSAPDPAEQAMVRSILSSLTQPVTDLSGRLSLKELGALLARARLFVGVDSAPMHLAAAVGTPTVALFGPSGEVEWAPWGVPSRVLTSDHRCRPCGFDGCGGGKVSACLEAIAPLRVLAAVEDLLEATA